MPTWANVFVFQIFEIVCSRCSRLGLWAEMCFILMNLCTVCALYWCLFLGCVCLYLVYRYVFPCVCRNAPCLSVYPCMSLAVVCVCARMCTVNRCVCALMNLSVCVAVLALYDRVWIIRNSRAIKPKAVRQDGLLEWSQGGCTSIS